MTTAYGSASGEAKAVDFTDDGVACDVAELASDLRSGEALSPECLEGVDALIGPAHEDVLSVEMKTARRGGEPLRLMMGRSVFS
jgi:hypothetical protein